MMKRCVVVCCVGCVGLFGVLGVGGGAASAASWVVRDPQVVAPGLERMPSLAGSVGVPGGVIVMGETAAGRVFLFGVTRRGTPLPGFGHRGLMTLPPSFGVVVGNANEPVRDSKGRIVFVLTRDGVRVVVRLRRDGTIDPTFGTDGIAIPPIAPDQAAVDVADRILVVGNGVVAVPGLIEPLPAVARLDTDGRPDAAFGVAGVKDPVSPDLSRLTGSPIPVDIVSLWDIASAGNGVLVSGGRFLGRLTQRGEAAAGFGTAGFRVLAPGTTDPLANWGPRASRILPVANGRFLVAGQRSHPAVRVERYRVGDGSRDTAYGTATDNGPDGAIQGIATSRPCGGATLVAGDDDLVILTARGRRDLGFGIQGTLPLPSPVGRPSDITRRQIASDPSACAFAAAWAQPVTGKGKRIVVSWITHAG